jgi:hypothetical protein
MTNRFTHSITWPDAKARIIDNVAELQAMIDDLIEAFPDGCNHVLDTKAQFQRIAKLTGL